VVIIRGRHPPTVVPSAWVAMNKGKVDHTQLRRLVWGVGSVCHSFSTSALGGDERSTTLPGRCTPGKEPRYSVNENLGGPQNQFGPLWRKMNIINNIGCSIQSAIRLAKFPPVLHFAHDKSLRHLTSLIQCGH